MLSMPITAMVGRMVFVLSRVSVLWVVGLLGWHDTCTRCRPFDQFIEFTTVKPNPPTLRAVVNFNALAVGDQEVGVRADGAFHRFLSFEFESELMTQCLSGPALTGQRTESR